MKITLENRYGYYEHKIKLEDCTWRMCLGEFIRLLLSAGYVIDRGILDDLEDYTE